jgi:LPXTG-motif cell wall-anchored protein
LNDAARTMVDAILSLTVLAGFALLGGGVWLIARRRDSRKGVLMLVAAAVLFANVAIWTVPLD